MRLFVGQIPKTWDDCMILQYFQRFGSIIEARIIRDKCVYNPMTGVTSLGAHKGCAFLRCAYYHEAEIIMREHI